MHVDTRTVTSVVLAVACVVAVAAAADGFASLSTDPEDVVDPEFDRLPAGEGELEALRDEVSSRRGSSGLRADESEAGDESVSQSEESREEREVSTRATTQAESSAPQSTPESAESRASRDRSQSESSPQPPDRSDGWPALLAALAALATVAALGYRYAGRLGPDDGEPPAAFGDADPGSEIERAWLKLVRRVDADVADSPEARTPREWASAAVDAGLDADAVTTVTRAFESVRYGGRDETEERRRRVRRAVDRLDALPRETDGGTERDADERREGAR